MPVLPRINRNLDNPTRPSVKTRSFRNTQGNTPQPERADASHWMLNEAVGTSLVLIDPAVSNLDLLVDGVLPGIEVRVLAGDRDGITQITEILQTRSSIDRLHIVAHGSPGCLYLGNARLDRATLSHYAPALQRWSKALSPKAIIALYGCALGADADHSPSLLSQLHQLTGRAIAASSTPIGDAALGGNWELDVMVGDRPLPDYSALPFLAFTPQALQAYPAIFATYTVTNTNDSGAGSLRQAIIDANGNLGADLITFNILGAAPFTINLDSALPAIVEAVTIDATTQAGYVDAPVIEISGSSAGASANGFSVEFAGDVTLRGFAINGFDGAGINLSYANNVLIEGNYIGTSLDGTTAIANGVGIQVSGSGSFSNTIGGTIDAARNVISGNTNEGVLISGASGTTVVGNYIGTAADGTTALGNGGSGVATLFGPGSTIGGTGAGEGNTIAYNGGNGVGVLNSGTTVSGNSIFGNSGLGVDLGSNGVTANDAGDGDTGANSLQNFPVFSSVTTTDISGNLNSTASSNFRIEYFASASPDGSGNGEGQIFLGSQTVVTDGSGNAPFSFAYSFDPAHPYITATATNTATFNTSEFSAAGTAAFVVTNTNDSGAGSLRQAIIGANGAAGADYIIFNIPGSGPHTINLTSALPSITGQVSLDGTTQPGFAGSPQIVLNGAAIATPGSVGLILASGSDNSTVRGLVIQNFPSNGMRIDSSGNTIAGNYIGTSADGTAAAANGFHGIVLFGSSNNTIGGTTAADRNVISGNAQSGISGSGSNNTIVGNYIGTDAAGTGAIGNSQHGINLAITGSSNTIGGTTTGARNVISGNAQNGINFGGTNSNTIVGNYIGVDATGTVDLGNGQAGVFVSASSSNNTIGGAAAGAGNVISGNNTTGISILSTNNAVRANLIGTNATGTADVGNSQDGVYIENAFNTVGGTTAGERNVISGNNNAGIRITGSFGISNTIQGNYIGTDATGTGAIANSTGGIAIVNSASNNTIGGTPVGAGNVISGNNGAGVDISDLASGNTVQGNLIGTDAAGILALGNSDAGVGILNATNNQIGGATPESRNIISGNTGSGVLITNGSSGNQIQGNYIGADITGTGAIANTGDGVLLGDTASNNLIGGTAAGAGNLISGNNGDGVETLLTSGTGNAISRNSIVGNGELGIDLGGDGITSNDLDDIDAGANNLQNFPVIDTVTVVGGDTTITGSFTGAANTTFDVELFSNTATDPSGNGEGQTYLTTISVTTDGSGIGTINETLVGVDLTGLFVAATATDLSGNTSEFSGAIEALAGSNPLIVTNTDDSGVGSLRAAIAFANSNPGSDTITFDTTSGVFADATPDIILLTSGGLAIADDLTITGLGANLLTIQRDAGASDFRLFTINNGAGSSITVDISGFTLSGGRSNAGGAILSYEALTISDSIIRNNTATFTGTFNTGVGGAIWQAFENLTIVNSLIAENVAGDRGGAIFYDGATINIQGSQISDNTAVNEGGGIYSIVGNVAITNSTISGNTVTGSLADGGGIWHNSGNLLVEASTISNNSANDSGGGIFTFIGSGSNSATIRNSTISGNAVGGVGGGLFNGAGLTTIENSTITNNEAPNGSGSGVGLDADSAANVEVTSSIIAGNVNSDVDFVFGPNNLFFSNGNNLIGTGSGLTNTGNGSGFTQPTDITGVTDPGLNPLADNGGPTQTHSLTDTSLARDAGSNPNGLTTDQRGAGFDRVIGSSADIGAFEAPEPNPLVVTNTNDSGVGSLRAAIAFANSNPGADTITFDTTSGIFSDAIPDTISLTSGGFTIIDTVTITGLGASLLTIQRDTGASDFRLFTIDDGTASQITVDISGFTLTGGSIVSDSGGAIFNRENLTISDSILQNNTATFGGGAIDNQGLLTVENSTISNNTASFGGAISNQGSEDAATTIINSTISNNQASGNGGALYNDSGTINIESSTVSNNIADSNGGAVYNAFGDVNVLDSTLTNNETLNDSGGAIYNESSNLTVTNSTLSANVASDQGGAIWSDNGAINIQASQISGNTSFRSGGGIFNNQGSLSILTSTISNNTVAFTFADGGGIWHLGDGSGEDLTITASTISGNSTNGFGGGIWTSTDLGVTSTTILSSTISGNTAADGSGGLQNDNGLVTISNSTITNNTAPAGQGSGVGSFSDISSTRTEVLSSIIAGNVNSDIDILFGSNSSFVSNGNNLIGTGEAAAIASFNQPTDITGVTDPGLNPLADNGGPTPTHSLTNTSPARDGGDANGQTRDQRGFPRVIGSSADIGAFEAPELDPLVVINTNDSGIGSLREAIAFANSNPGADTITFNIPTSDPGYNSTTGAYTISLLSGLPEITDAITIDGTSQTGFPGSPIIVLDGALAGDTSGLVLAPGSDGSFIQSLIINNFQSSGRSGISIASSNNTIQGNYIGADVTGTTAAGNTVGITLFTSAANNLIGGTDAETRNLISGNLEDGIFFLGADNNTVQGNYIGTDVTGTAVLGNGQYGLDLGAGASGNTIGGGAPGAGNIISGNSLGGISLSGADNNAIQANIIGTDFTRTLDLGNGSFGGISLTSGAFDNTIGGPIIRLGNVIAFNDGDGISSNPFDPAGTGNELVRNSIFSNTGLGIDLGDEGVTPNDLGDGDTGSNNLQNFAVLTGAATSGGNTDISGTLNSTTNTTFRVELFISDAADPSGNGEGQSSIGFVNVTTDASGNATFSETFTEDYSGSLITAIATNLITNDSSEFSSALAVNSPLVVTNTNDSGAGSLRDAIAFANINPGADTITFNIAGGGAQTINLLSALPSITGSVTIDGTTQPGYTNTPLIILNGSGAGFASTGLNLFSGNNTIKGLEIIRFNRGIGISSSNNTIQGNSLILNTFGISVDAGTNNQIGGTTAGAGNVISVNFSTGLAIATSDTTVQGNQIQGNPVGIFLSGANNTIGGEATGAGNVISGSQDDGITIIGTGSTGNLISRNSIHNNGSIPTTDDLGIDLDGDGITANDAGDGDVGPNGLQNTPVITAATLDGGTTRLAGTFNSTPNTTFRLEFFSDSAPNLIGTWEGETFLGSVDVTTDASGNATFNPVFATAVALGQGITATARNLANNNTSEFSAASIVTAIPTVSISPLEITQTEGNSGTTAYTYTVTLSNASASPVTVNYSTNNGTATAVSDYVDNGGALVFNPGDPLTQTITVLVNGDTTFEGTEDFTVTLNSAVNGTLGTSSAAGVITNDDAQPTISISDFTLVEGNSGTTNAVFTVSLSNPSSQTITVNYATANDTAIAGSDYVGISTTTLTFAPGETSKIVNVAVSGDTITEGNETFTVNLSSPTNATLADGQGLGIITNDDGVPTVSISPASITQLEGNSGTTAYVYTVTLSNASASPVTVNYSTNNGTATTADGDYVDNDGALIFNPGDPLTQTITVLVNGDTTFEGTEDFTVTLNSAVNGTLGTSSAAGIITNDDAQPTISISDFTLAEGNSGTTNAVFTVSLSNPSSQTITVNYATANDTAIAGSDYVGISTTTLTFAPGETSKIVNVAVSGDTITEGNETFTVNLSSPTNATLADGQGLGIITNDDGVPTVSISPASITQLEGNSGTTAYVYTVTLSNASASPITVNYSTNNGTATTANNDYVDNDGSLVFNPGGSLTQTITVLVNGDTLPEGDENFTVQLNSAVSAVLGTTTATGTITSDDTAQASFSLSQILLDGDGAIFNGRATGDFAGGVASNAGDLNNDGFDDILISSRKADPSGRTDAGEAYVIFGNATGTYPTSLSSLNGTNGFRLEGIARFDGNGFAGQSAGDINGDGFDDLIVGARTADANGKSDSGQAYIIFGKASGFTSSISLSTLNGTNGFRINGINQYDNAGHSVSGIGDIDGDGLDDIAISAVGADPSARSNAGQVYVLFGKRTGFTSSLNLSSLPTTGGNATGFRLSGLVAGDSLGYSLSSAGDLNNDGVDDLIIGATGADPNGSNSGQAYVVFGNAGLKTAGLSNLGALDGSNGFRINGAAASDNAGLAVTSIGDMNNDGIDDIAIASPYADASNPNAGAVYVVFGKTGGFSSSLNLSSLNGSNGFRVTGIDADDLTGLAISSAGDFNEDGIDDLLIGAPYADPSGTSSGEAYVVYGSSSFAASISLTSLNGSNGLTITGITANSLTGFSVGSGNFNGNAGLLLGAPNSGSGAAYAIFNSILS